MIILAALSVIGSNLYRNYADNALISAIQKNDVAAVRSLLDRGANPNAAQAKHP